MAQPPEPDVLALLLDKLPASAAWLAGAALSGWALFARLRRSVSADDTSTKANTAWSEIISNLRSDVVELRREAKAYKAERDVMRSRIDVLERDLMDAHRKLADAGITQPGRLGD